VGKGGFLRGHYSVSNPPKRSLGYPLEECPFVNVQPLTKKKPPEKSYSQLTIDRMKKLACKKEIRIFQGYKVLDYED